jgi:hypothetical protein
VQVFAAKILTPRLFLFIFGTMNYHIELDIDFQRNTLGGLYIAIEGIDGSGKSTQVARLEKYFKEQNRDVIVTSEPQHGSAIEKMIRDVIQSKTHLPTAALQYLYSADRVINQEAIVKPALQQGKIVLSHRVFWSAVPYGVMDKILDLPACLPTGKTGGQVSKNGTYDFNQSSQIMIAQGLLLCIINLLSLILRFTWIFRLKQQWNGYLIWIRRKKFMKKRIS